jgi:chemotaxis response regulator CheB
MSEAPIRVLLADDDQAFLEALRELIDSQPELTVVAAAQDGLEAVTLADEHDVHAAVVDLHMPRLDGVSAILRGYAATIRTCFDRADRRSRRAAPWAALGPGRMPCCSTSSPKR